ncbi:transcription initiation factor TFIID subunit 3-like [Tigriopus californicus]|nr:transcription initiation factor TFIID subunit 3-like [Tigriopus californicus]
MVHSGKKDSASASASGSMASGASGLSLSGSTWPGCTPKPDVDDYANQVLRQRLGTLLLQMGWQSAHNSSLNVLVDLAGRYLRDLGSHCQSQAELSNRSQANILDVARTLADFRIQTADLADYADCLPRGSGPTAGGIPYFPRPSVTQLNFLKPGSREVLHRKVYVNDYFPPMYPNLEEEEGEGSERDVATMDTDAPTPSGEIVGQVGGPGPESLPVREIASVMMTSAGFISPAREGKLPESRTPYVHEMVRERESEAHKVVQAEGKAHFKAKMKAKNAGSMDKKLKVFQKKAPKVQPHAHSPPKSIVSETSMNDHHIDDTINAVIQRGLKDSNKPKPLPESPPKRGRPPKRKASECVPEPRLDLSPGEIVEPEVETPPPPPPSKPKKAKVPKSAANPPASATPASSKKTMSTPRKLAGVDDEPIKTPPTPEILREKEAMRKAKATNADTPTPPPSLPAKSPEPEKIRKKEKKKKAKKDKKDSRGEKRDKSKKAEKREKDRDKTNKAITKLKIKDTSSVTGASPEPPPPIPPVSVSISVSNTPTTSKPTKKSKADSAKKIPELKLFLPTATIKKNPVEPIKTNITLPPAPLEPAKITAPVPPKKEKIVKRRKSTKAPPAPPSASSSSVVAAASTPTPTPPSRSGPPTTKATAVDGNAGGSITTRTVGHYVDADGNQIWICPACGKQDDGSPMIGCDECDDWYHWLCVGIRSEPDESQNWFCQRCVARKRGPML